MSVEGFSLTQETPELMTCLLTEPAVPPFRRLHIRQWADFPELLLAPGPSQSLEEHGGPFLIGAFASWVETISSHRFALMQHTNLQIQD